MTGKEIGQFSVLWKGSTDIYIYIYKIQKSPGMCKDSKGKWLIQVGRMTKNTGM